MTSTFTTTGPFSNMRSISAQHLNPTIFGAAFPATVLCSPVAGFSLTQPCSSKFVEETILVLPDVLTLGMVGKTHDGRFFQSHLFFLNPRENHE